MAMEDRIQSTIVGKQQFQEEYDLVGIYRNQERERSFSEYMNPNALERHWIYPITNTRRILWVAGLMTGPVAALFFSTKFLKDQSVQQDLLKKLKLYGFTENEIRIYFYKIVK